MTHSTLALTFDNLGEALELEFGVWPEGQPIGRHYSVESVLPKLLKCLEGVRATFFIEAWNAVTYPAALRAIVGAGHEVALHGWRHEAWAPLSVENQTAVLSRSLDAYRRIGISPVGFRPPGGELGPRGVSALRQAGIQYVSPVGEETSVKDEISVLPFRWSEVDAFYLEPYVAELRVKAGLSPDPLPISVWHAALDAALTALVNEGRSLIALFHPYLLGRDPVHFEVLRAFIARIASERSLRVTTCAEMAATIQSPAPIH